MIVRSKHLSLTAFLAVVCLLGTAAAAPTKKSRKSAPKEVDTVETKTVATPPSEAAEAPSDFAVPTAVRTKAQVQAEEEAADPEKKKNKSFGAGGRVRWVTIPRGILNWFTDANVPLNSFGLGAELFLRRKTHDIVLGIVYQNMSPGDGNWLGNGKVPALDTDYIQFKGFGLVGIDVAFVERYDFNQYIGLHYGAGIGVALVTGKIMRTSSAGCTSTTVNACRPAVCTTGACTEDQLKAIDGPTPVVDDPSQPVRFEEKSVPPVLPIINLLFGFNFHFPQVKGLELRLEGGFYNALFVGLGGSYPF